MKAHLIYNPHAGSVEMVTADDLLAALESAGYDPSYQPTEEEADLDQVLAEAQGLVVVAGGDGTVRAVLERLVGREAHVATLPLGTANNVCRTLGVEGTPLEIIAGLKEPRHVPFDLGQVRMNDVEVYFLEGMGCGIFGNAFAAYHEGDEEAGEKSLLSSIEAVMAAFNKALEPERIEVVADGQRLTDPLLAVEVLNTPFIGPNLELAPDADPNDGRLDVVRVCPDAFEDLWVHVQNLLEGEIGELPRVLSRSAQEVVLRWWDLPLHVDGEVLEVPRGQEVTARVRVLHHAVEFWLPPTRGEG
jgi:diacylglycerol kinase family enzyme